ncbi:helix-turn-helix domain-containing protein [Rubrobacter marinus]|uniref:hypothetical protein n=1 Tax=Rubrobacter marinus TaxID=2653852 RepID=UPI001A9CF5C6
MLRRSSEGSSVREIAQDLRLSRATVRHRGRAPARPRYPLPARGQGSRSPPVLELETRSPGVVETRGQIRQCCSGRGPRGGVGFMSWGQGAPPRVSASFG